MEPGTLWSYSNPGYWLAGLVIEEVSRKHFADAVNDEVLAPVGMKRSTFRPTAAMTWPVAIGHGPEGSGNPSVVRPLADNAAGWPAGQLFSSAPEFARFCIAFVNGGKIDGAQVLSPSIIEQLSKPHVPVPGSERSYGYGLAVEEHNGLHWLSHGGSRTGYGSFVKICPEKKFAVVVLCNKTGERLSRVTDKAIELGLGISSHRSRSSQERLPSTQEELQRYAGVYSNGETTVRLVLRDGKLMGPLDAEINKVGEHRFRGKTSAIGTEAEFFFVPGPGGRIEYLHRGARALKKQD
jgi:CubicO group peptidase (beta-lactamase class C family)